MIYFIKRPGEVYGEQMFTVLPPVTYRSIVFRAEYIATIRYTMPPKDSKKTIPDKPNVVQAPEQLRWDHADVLSYYNYTRIYLQPVLAEINGLKVISNDFFILKDSAEFNRE